MSTNTTGSVWKRWDLHLHTPETIKEDRYEGSSPEDKWQKFFDTINTYTGQVDAIGITDYLSVDNYKHFIANKSKLTYPITLVLPNVEMRMVPVTGSGTPINIHCIFNPEIIDDLEDKFFSKLTSASDQSITASRAGLTALGRDSHEGTLADDAAYRFGIKQFVTDPNSLKKLFFDNPSLRKNTIVVVSNSKNDGVSGIVEHYKLLTEDGGSQLATTRTNIYKMADAVFSSSQQDVDYFCGRKIGAGGKLIDRSSVIKKSGSLKPCYHGSDAHTNNKVFRPDENRFCWIKAELTFEGLRQTVYEPYLRVRIQEKSPDTDFEKVVIGDLEVANSEKLKILDQKIGLNRDLIAIIGGRGSGKSLLLETIASLNEEHVPLDMHGKAKVIESLRQQGAEAKITVNLIDKDYNQETLSKQFTQTHSLDLPILYIGQEKLSQVATDDELLTPTVLSFLGIENQKVDTSLIDTTIPHDISRIEHYGSVIENMKIKYAYDDDLAYDLLARMTALEDSKYKQIKRLSSEKTELLVAELISVINKGQKIKNIKDALPIIEHELDELRINKQIQNINKTLADAGFEFLEQIPEITTNIQNKTIVENSRKLEAERLRLAGEYTRITGELKKLGIKEDVRLLTESIRKLQDEINAIGKDKRIYEDATEELATYKGELVAMGKGLENFTTWAAQAIDLSLIHI